IISFAVLFIHGDNDIISEMSQNGGNNLKTIQVIAGIVMAAAFGAIGFLDDYIKVVKKRNLGLTAKQKTLMQIAVAAAYLAVLGIAGMDSTYIPFIGDVDITGGIGIIFWPIALIFIYGFTNAVNLTDGIDGLCSLATTVVSAFYILIFTCIPVIFSGYMIISAALSGGCLGFFIWNMHPARVFMGDTGSMFLGGMVVAFSFASGRPILLIFSGILYLLEALSVVVQVAYYKKTKKRLFRMSPIHHHFELCGWSENKIVIVFCAVALIGCSLATILTIFG
ncbi:MAG: phospho-N-acetylmuramoyl-pentapeptide-transferase, partial [Acutalibacteraceae bacterium]